MSFIFADNRHSESWQQQCGCWRSSTSIWVAESQSSDIDDLLYTISLACSMFLESSQSQSILQPDRWPRDNSFGWGTEIESGEIDDLPSWHCNDVFLIPIDTSHSQFKPEPNSLPRSETSGSGTQNQSSKMDAMQSHTSLRTSSSSKDSSQSRSIIQQCMSQRSVPVGWCTQSESSETDSLVWWQSIGVFRNSRALKFSV